MPYYAKIHFYKYFYFFFHRNVSVASLFASLFPLKCMLKKSTSGSWTFVMSQRALALPATAHSTRCPFLALEPHVSAKNEKQWACKQGRNIVWCGFLWNWYIFETIHHLRLLHQYKYRSEDVHTMEVLIFNAEMAVWLCDVCSLLQGKGPVSF